MDEAKTMEDESNQIEKEEKRKEAKLRRKRKLSKKKKSMKEKFKQMTDKFLNNTEESMATIMQELQTEEAEELQCHVCSSMIGEAEDYVVPAILQNSNVTKPLLTLVPVLVPDHHPAAVPLRARVGEAHRGGG